MRYDGTRNDFKTKTIVGEICSDVILSREH